MTTTGLQAPHEPDPPSPPAPDLQASRSPESNVRALYEVLFPRLTAHDRARAHSVHGPGLHSRLGELLAALRDRHRQTRAP